MFGGWEGWSGESRSSGFPRDFIAPSVRWIPLLGTVWCQQLALVIPAPIAYIKVVVVKKLVVGSRRSEGGSLD